MKQNTLIAIAAISTVLGIGTWMILPNSVWADAHLTGSLIIKVIASILIGVAAWFWYKIIKGQ